VNLPLAATRRERQASVRNVHTLKPSKGFACVSA
jgi:hypothetical protein